MIDGDFTPPDEGMILAGVTRPAPEYAGLVERLAGMEPLDTAPRDRTHILAKTLPRDDQWSNYGGRWFVVWHIDKVSGWSLFPGMGVGDDWFEGWVRLPLAAATALTALTERNKALEAEVERLRGGIEVAVTWGKKQVLGEFEHYLRNTEAKFYTAMPEDYLKGYQAAREMCIAMCGLSYDAEFKKLPVNVQFDAVDVASLTAALGDHP